MPDNVKDDGPENDDTPELDETQDNSGDADVDDSDDGDDGGDFKPPTKEEWIKVQAALKRAKNQAANLRKKNKEDTKDDSGKEDKPEPKSDPDIRLKRAAGVTALVAEGLSKDQAKVALRLMDLSSVDVDDDGDADFDDEIEALKDTFPALFDREARRTVTRVKTSGGRSDGGSAMTPDEKASLKMLRAAGFRR